MDCNIHAHDDRSPNNGSTATALCKQPRDDHERSICNIYREAKRRWDEEPLSRKETKPDDTGRAAVAPPANSHLCLRHAPTHTPLESRALVAAGGV